MNNTVIKGKLADNKAHNRQLEEHIQSLTEIRASMAALLGNSDATTSQSFQDKMKKMAKSFKRHSTSSIDARDPAPMSVRIEVPAWIALLDNTATSTSTPLPQVTHVQPGNQQASAGEVGNTS